MSGLRTQLQEHVDVASTRAWAEGVPGALPGDCWRACLASLLEVPMSETPHFVALYPDVDDELSAAEGPAWWRASKAWVEEIRPGWTIAAWDVPEVWHPIYLEPSGMPDRVILSGRSPRGDWLHSALVWDADGTLAHDPFPGGIAAALEAVPEPQGEPSDAQVVAALNAFWPDSAAPSIHSWTKDGFADDMRAALRAARGVR